MFDPGAVLATVTHSTLDMVIAKDLDGIVTFCNPAVQDIFGYSPTDLVGSSVTTLLPPNLEFEELQIREQIHRGQIVAPFKTKRQTKSGLEVDVTVSVSPMMGVKGEIVGAVQVMRLLPQSIPVEASTKLLEDLGILMTESSEDCIYVLDVNGRMIYANKQAVTLNQGNPAQFKKGVVWPSLWGSKDSDEIWQIVNEAINKRAPQRIQKQSSQSGNWWDVRFDPIMDTQNCVVQHLVVSARDITEIKAAQEVLRQQAVLHSISHEPIITWTLGGAITSWNHGAERIYGYTACEAIGQVSHELLRTSFPLTDGKAELEHLLREHGTWSGEIVHLTKCGKPITVLSTQQMVDENTLLILETNRDVTELKETQAQLELADERKNQFIADLSHEIRSPLSALIFASSALTERRQDDSQELVNIIARQANQISVLLEDLLDITRIANGKLALSLTQVNLGRIAQEIVSSLRPSAEANQQTLVLDPECLPALDVEADEARIRQIMTNLINNAIKYAGSGTRISVCISAESEDAIISVSDNGNGIEPGNLEAIFNRFTQVDRHVERRQGGLGIGLALVRRLVELHGGSVHAQSAGIGHGSTFIVRLPKTAKRSDQ